MSSSKERNQDDALIIEHWFRTLCTLSFLIVNIMHIIQDFAKECETVDLSTSYKGFTYDEEN